MAKGPCSPAPPDASESTQTTKYLSPGALLSTRAFWSCLYLKYRGCTSPSCILICDGLFLQTFPSEKSIQTRACSGMKPAEEGASGNKLVGVAQLMYLSPLLFLLFSISGLENGQRSRRECGHPWGGEAAFGILLSYSYQEVLSQSCIGQYIKCSALQGKQEWDQKQMNNRWRIWTYCINKLCCIAN